jgi:hypothetical protein
VLKRTATAISSALLVLACSCSGSGGGQAQQSPTSTAVKRRPPTTRSLRPTTTIYAGPTTVAVPPPPGLADLILSTGPAGFEQQPDAVGDTGPTNLAKATNDDISQDGRRALLSAGFEAGYQRQWTSIDPTGNTPNQDFVFLYRFATPAGAQSYVQHWQVTLLTTNTSSATIQSFTPPFIPGAIGLSAIDSKQGSTGVVLFAKGQYAVQALVIGGPSVDQSGSASDMAYAQYQRLP